MDGLSLFTMYGEAAVMQELLQCNNELNSHGLSLTNADVTDILTARKEVLESQGRIELDNRVLRGIIGRVAVSAYVSPDNLKTTINEMYEVFHYIKNATSDVTSDDDILDAMYIFYEKVCRGSTELLMGKGIEKILDNFRAGRELAYIINEEEEAEWESEA